jgi:hypothetical protein
LWLGPNDKIWDLSTYTCIETIATGKGRSICCSLQLQDGQLLVGSLDFTMKILNLKTIPQQRWERRRHFLLVIKAFQILILGTRGFEKERLTSLTSFLVESMRGEYDDGDFKEKMFGSSFLIFSSVFFLS